MLARYYSSSLGRFMAVDALGGKVGNPQSWNRYSYAHNNPGRFVDLDGLLAVDAALAKQFPKAAAFILNLKPRAADYKAYGGISPIRASEVDVDNAFKTGGGPTVKSVVPPATMTGPEFNGHYPHDTDPQIIEVGAHVLHLFEHGVFGSKTWLEAILKHEVAHYLDYRDGRGAPYEVGWEFEEQVYGSIITGSLEKSAAYERNQEGDGNQRPDPRSSFSNFAAGIQGYMATEYKEWKRRYGP